MKIWCNICNSKMAVYKQKKRAYIAVMEFDESGHPTDFSHWDEVILDEKETALECTNSECKQRIVVDGEGDIKQRVIGHIFPSSWDETNSNFYDTYLPERKKELMYENNLLYCAGFITKEQLKEKENQIDKEIEKYMLDRPNKEIKSKKKWYLFWK
jgi:hypothetical protein